MYLLIKVYSKKNKKKGKKVQITDVSYQMFLRTTGPALERGHEINKPVQIVLSQI